jgi:hypothetical protein
MSDNGIAASLNISGIVRDGKGNIVDVFVSEEDSDLYLSIKKRILETGEPCPSHIMEKIDACISSGLSTDIS